MISALQGGSFVDFINLFSSPVISVLPPEYQWGFNALEDNAQ